MLTTLPGSYFGSFTHWHIVTPAVMVFEHLLAMLIVSIGSLSRSKASLRLIITFFLKDRKYDS